MLITAYNEIGLTENEAEIYELLVSTGKTDAARLIKESNIKRATVYKSLYGLQEKGLILVDEKVRGTTFEPLPPKNLLEYVQDQLDNMKSARNAVSSILPELQSSFLMATEQPIVTTFSGVSGLKKIYRDTLKEGKTIYAALQTESVDPELFEWLTGPFVKQRVKAGIETKVIVASGSWADTYESRNQQELRETIRVPKSKYPFQHETFIYGDKFGIMNYRQDTQLVGMIINHPQIAKTMKALFDLAWEGATHVAKQN